MDIMGRHESLSRSDAEDLLDGRHGSSEVAALLAALRADSGDRPVHGESEALLAFRSARIGTASPGFLRRLASSIRVAAAATALAVAGGGVALASTDVLPLDIVSQHRPEEDRSGPAASAASPSTPTSLPAARTSSAAPSGDNGSVVAGGESSGSAAVPSNEQGLCTAIVTGQVDVAQVAATPAFASLAAAAGGEGRVTDYCTALLATTAPADAATGNVTPHPSAEAPATTPGAWPTSRTGGSTPPPSNTGGRPVDPPTGKPAEGPPGLATDPPGNRPPADATP
jgi:hypothetical protein